MLKKIANLVRCVATQLIALYFMLGSPSPIWAAVDRPSDLCGRALQLAAAETGVPIAVLRAISMIESGRSIEGAIEPWPWAVNMQGAGHWFNSRREALTFIKVSRSAGAESFDVGCFQINFRWHGHAFPSIEAMIDPETNARYAADFLAQLYEEFGDWSAAAGAYHSRTAEFANRYRSRFDRTFATLSQEEEGPTPTRSYTPEPVQPTPNTFPLLVVTGSQGHMGSLVPLSGTKPTSPRLVME